jgi:ABC-type polysaccharide/polyol phosphate export permease
MAHNPSLDYDSAARRIPVIEELLELLRYRDLLQLLVANSIKTRYKRSALGVVWTLLHPLLTMAVLSVAFSAVFHTQVVNYPVYILAGLICWNFFAQSTSVATGSLVWGGSLLKRIYIPRAIFSVAAIGNGLVNLALALGPLVVIMLVLRQPLRPALVFLPVSIGLVAMFALGVALFLSTLAVFFVDVVDLYTVLLSVWFYLTPVIYPTEIVPARYLWLLRLNPMYSLLDLFRAPIYRGALPETWVILTAGAWALGALVIGWWTFTRKADEFAYRV